MADQIKYEIGFSDEKLNEFLHAMVEASQVTGKAADELGATIEKRLAQAIENGEDLVSVLDEITTASEKSGQEIKKSDGFFKQFAKGIGDSLSKVKILGVELGTIGQGVKQFASFLGLTTKATGALAKGFKFLKIALISSGIGAIVVLLGSLAAVLAKSEKVMAFFNRTTTAGGAAIKTLVTRIETDGIRGFVGLGRAMKDSAQDAYDAALALQVLEQQLKGLALAQEVAKGLISEYLDEFNDQTKSIQDRQAISDRIAQTELFYANRSVEASRAKLEALKAQNAATDDINDAQSDLIRKEIELSQVYRDSDARKKKLSEEQTDRVNKQREAVEKLRDEYRKLIETLSEQSQAAQLDAMSDVDRLLAEREIALAGVKELREQIIALSDSTGLALPDDFDQQTASIVAQIERDFQKEINKLREGGNDPLSQLVTIGDPATLEARIQESVKAVGATIETVVQDVEIGSVFDKWQKQILDGLGLSPEQGAFIVDQFKSVLSSIRSISEANTELQLAQQDRIIKKREDSVSKLEADLQREQDLQDKGLANNVERIETALAEENALLHAAENERLEIEKAAAKKRLIADSLQQASQLTLAAAKVITAESGKGLIGILTAIAGISLLFGTIAKAKANAKEFSQVPKLRKGAKLEGASHEQGGIDILMGGKRAYEAEAGEWLIGSAPSKEHDAFLGDLNKGRYKNVPLQSIAESAVKARQFIPMMQTAKAEQRTYRSLKETHNSQMIERAIREEIQGLRSGLFERMDSKPTIIPAGAHKEVYNTPAGKTVINKAG